MKNYLVVLIGLFLAAHSAAESIHGIVISGAGKPVANAQVAAYAVEAPRASMERIAAARSRPVLATATSNADGAFAIDVPGRGIVILGVTAPDFVRSFSQQVIGDDDVIIELTHAKPVEWTVQFAGKPVAGARAVVYEQNGDTEVKSDTAGKFTIAGPTGAWLLVFANGYAPQMGMLAGPNVVVLERGAAVHGQVIGPDHAGMPGARLLVNAMPVATSAPDGTFTVPNMPSKSFMIEADSGEFYGNVSGTRSPLTIRIQKQLTLSGVVRDATGHPLRGVSLFAMTASNEGVDLVAVSGENGAFTFHLRPGKYALNTVSEYRMNAVTVDLGKPLVRDFVVNRAPALTGTVRTEEGAPVANAHVQLAIEIPGDFETSFDALPQLPSTMTKPDGRFRMRVEQAEMTGYLEATKDGYALSESGEIALAGAVAPIAIVMKKGIEVPVQVTDVAGRPVAGAAVASTRARRIMGGSAAIMTDDGGRAMLRLTEGTWRVRAAKDGYVPKMLPDVAVNAKSGPIALQLESAATLRGHVVSSDGKPVAGIAIALESGKAAMTGEDGAFSFTGIEKGTLNVHYLTSDGIVGTQTVNVPSDDVRIVLGETVDFSGRVVDASGNAVTDFSAAVEQTEFSMARPRQFSDPNGAFEWKGAPAGLVRVTVTAPAFVTATKEITLAPGKPVEGVTIILTRGRVVRGKVTNANGEPLSSADVTVTDRSEPRTSPPNTQSGDDGSYELSGVTSGAATISVRKQGFIQARRELGAGKDDANIDIQLAAGKAVSGHVVSADGKPVPGANVSAQSAVAGAGYGNALAGNDGAFSIDGLVPGRYDFIATGGGFADGKLADVDVTRVSDITIRMQPPTNATITGTVSGGEGATISISASGTSERTASPDGSGRYRIDNAPTGVVTVTAMTFSRSRRRSSTPVTVDVAPNSTTTVDLSFPEQVAISGHVTANDAPLAGARVTFEGSDSAASVTGDTGAYDAKITPGHYTVGVVSPSIPGGYTAARDIAGAGTVDISIQTNVITVTVVDATTGTPVERAAVSTRDEDAQTHTQARGVTAANGQVSISLPRDVKRIVVEKDGYATAMADVKPSLTVPLTRSEGALVRIVDARDGRTLSGYAIARDDFGRVIASSSDETPDGTLRLPLLPGKYRFSASASEYGSETVAAEVPVGEVRIALPRGGKLSLQSRAPLDAMARLIESDGEEYVRCWCSGIAEIRISGRVTLVDSIAPGSYTLEVASAGAKPRRIPVTVIEGETTAVSIDP